MHQFVFNVNIVKRVAVRLYAIENSKFVNLTATIMFILCTIENSEFVDLIATMVFVLSMNLLKIFKHTLLMRIISRMRK